MRVVVTGAAGLIGRVLTSRFAAAGADVVAVDIDADGLTKEFTGTPRVLQVHGDVADEAFADELVARFTGLDVLVNNAALTNRRVPFLETGTQMFDDMIAANLRSVYLLSRQLAREWARSRTAGVIVNLSSPGATRSHTAQSLYDTSKAGVEALSRSMAVELGPLGIRVNCLCPAAVAESAVPTDDVPLRTRITPDDVADAALFLASPAAKHVTGIVLPVDGGLGAQLRVPIVRLGEVSQ